VTTDIATQTDNAPIPGFEHFDAEDQALPRIKICQPTSRDGTPGTFKDSLAGDELTELDVVVLSYSKSRVMFVKGQDDPACKSLDNISPDPRIDDAPATSCELCANSAWLAAPDENGSKAPRCKVVYNLVCADADTKEPFLMSLHGSQIKPIKGFLTTMFRKRLPLYSSRTTLTLDKTSGTRGVYYTINFGDITELKDTAPFAALYAQFVGYDAEKTFAAETELAPPVTDDDMPF
jgi:hypothetical protein